MKSLASYEPAILGSLSVWLIPLPLLLENTLYHYLVGGKLHVAFLFLLTDDPKTVLFPFLVVMALFWSIDRTRLRLRSAPVVINLTLFGVLVAVTLLRARVPDEYSKWVFASRILLLFGTGITSLLWFLSPGEILRTVWTSRSRLERFSVFGLVGMFALGFGAKIFWPGVIYPLGHSVNGLLMLTPFAGQVEFNGVAYFSLMHPKFVLNVFAPCGGFEGLRFMALGLVIPLLMDHAVIGKRALLYLMMAIPLVFLLNVLRVATIYSMGAFQAENQAAPQALAGTINLFHNGSGAVIYGVGITLFVHFIYRYSPSVRPSK